MRRTLEEWMARAPIFEKLDPPARAALVGTARFRQLARGEAHPQEGELWPCWLLVGEGALHASMVSARGRKFTALELLPGDLFLAPTFFDDLPIPVSLEAKVPSTIWWWHRACLKPVLLNHPEALWEMGRALVRQMRTAAGVLEQFAFQPLTGRLARVLVDKFGHVTDRPAARVLTLDEMAARTGSTREVVCRLLSRMAEEGVISITRTQIRVLDPARLAALAGQAEPLE